jgi:hypothetical protein
MAGRTIFHHLRRRGAVLCAVFAYAILLNALFTALSDVQAIAAALGPLTAAATCDSSGSTGVPVPQNRQHQPDCTLCGPACPMAGSIQALDGASTVAPVPAPALATAAPSQRLHGIDPPSVYRSDAAAQAPPAIG